MFEQVSATIKTAIRELNVPVDGAALVVCFQLLDQFAAVVTEAVGDFDAAEAWKEDGATSMVGWLKAHTGRSGRQAAAMKRTGTRLRDLPVTSAAYRDGTLSSGQVEAIVANLNDKTAPLFTDTEAELVPTLMPLSVGDVSAVMQEWAQAAKDSLDDEPEPELPERSLHLSEILDGRRELRGSLDPEAGVIAETALRLAETTDSDAEPTRTPAHRRADALVDILRFYLDHQQTQLGGRHRPHLNVFVDYEDLLGTRIGQPANDEPVNAYGPAPSARFVNGTKIDAVTLHKLACDAAVHRVILQGRSSTLDYGWSTRTIAANLWAALVARDGHCRMYGCDRPPEWCEGHHVQWWEHGGPTNLGNLILGCDRHHHIWHLPGWHLKLHPDATLEITTPHGRHYTTHPQSQLPNLWTPD
ncbi:MAG TPA: DUF222 domain-containing protein [Acidimicrobiales bacterium]